jgi:hypothetical protein
MGGHRELVLAARCGNLDIGDDLENMSSPTFNLVNVLR